MSFVLVTCKFYSAITELVSLYLHLGNSGRVSRNTKYYLLLIRKTFMKVMTKQPH